MYMEVTDLINLIINNCFAIAVAAANALRKNKLLTYHYAYLISDVLGIIQPNFPHL